MILILIEHLEDVHKTSIFSLVLNFDRREILQETASHLVDSICAYRAGYMAEVSKLLTYEFILCNLSASSVPNTYCSCKITTDITLGWLMK